MPGKYSVLRSVISSGKVVYIKYRNNESGTVIHAEKKQVHLLGDELEEGWVISSFSDVHGKIIDFMNCSLNSKPLCDMEKEILADQIPF